ncbi:PREDICTED: uncharacterized protein LOC107067938 [Polistes dominula]|uniref:Uncharacterized protein LOC107067938 n=1 Tax=Polistes dominula TaxID=743375 RepID=A0ABM1IGN4_POLDO|nr:PREDICTED: uncharacterized protein LOC107067938 [Polistes dominula]
MEIISWKTFETNLKRFIGTQTLREEDIRHDEESSKFSETSYQDIFKKIDSLKTTANNFIHRMNTYNSKKTLPENIDIANYKNQTEKSENTDDKPVHIQLKVTNETDKPLFSTDTISNINRSLKEHLSLISDFNGSNRYVEGFINDVKFVLNLLTVREKTLFIKLVYAYKIKGAAKTLLDKFVISSIEDFFQKLRLCYKDINKFVHYKTIRKRCTQGTDSVLTYNKKFLRAEQNVLRTIYENENLTLCQKNTYMSIEKDNGLKEYISGLNYDFRVLLEIKCPRFLLEAQTMALDLEARQKNVF